MLLMKAMLASRKAPCWNIKNTKSIFSLNMGPVLFPFGSVWLQAASFSLRTRQESLSTCCSGPSSTRWIKAQ